MDFRVGEGHVVVYNDTFSHHTPSSSLTPKYVAEIREKGPGFVLVVPNEPVWDKDPSNNKMEFQEDEFQLHGTRLKGDCTITDLNFKPIGDKGNHLRVEVKMANQLPATMSNLRLILIKNHLSVKEWKPIGLGPHAMAQVHYQDDMPKPGQTSNYVVILTTDLSNPQPELNSVLDRKEGDYRRPGTVTGGM